MTFVTRNLLSNGAQHGLSATGAARTIHPVPADLALALNGTSASRGWPQAAPDGQGQPRASLDASGGQGQPWEAMDKQGRSVRAIEPRIDRAIRRAIDRSSRFEIVAVTIPKSSGFRFGIILMTIPKSNCFALEFVVVTIPESNAFALKSSQ